MPDTKFEKLKTALFMAGHDAISDFLGYDYPAGEDKNTTDIRMCEVYSQMPDEELEKFYAKYELS